MTAAVGSRDANADLVLRLEDELGHPPLGGYRPPVERTLLGSSGRAQAWVGGVQQAARRPILGYGFGTEDRVFVDRFYAFEGDFVENSYIGTFLQLGAAGVALLVGLLVTLAWNAYRDAEARVGRPGSRCGRCAHRRGSDRDQPVGNHLGRQHRRGQHLGLRADAARARGGSSVSAP